MFKFKLYYLLQFGIIGFSTFAILPVLFLGIGFTKIDIGYLMSTFSLSNILIILYTSFFSFKGRYLKSTSLMFVLSGLFLFYYIDKGEQNYLIVLPLVLFAFLNNINTTYIESMAVNQYDDRFGKIRGFGSFGFFIMGMLVFVFKFNEVNMFYLIVFASIIMFFVAIQFSEKEELHQEVFFKISMIKDELALWMMLLVMGIALAIYSINYALFMIESGISLSIVALILSISVLAETIGFYYQHLIFRLIDFKSLLFISIIATALRFLVIDYYSDDIIIQIAINTLHIFTFTFIYGSTILYLKNSQKEYYSYIKLYNAIYYGVGFFIGSFLSGYVMMNEHPFYIVSIIFLFALIPLYFIKGMQKKTYKIRGVKNNESC